MDNSPDKEYTEPFDNPHQKILKNVIVEKNDTNFGHQKIIWRETHKGDNPQGIIFTHKKDIKTYEELALVNNKKIFTENEGGRILTDNFEHEKKRTMKL